jgi:2,3-bisphosphoglycerate-dependent phosphoglycerate mutase
MIVSSPYARARSTVAALSRQTGIPITIEHDLRERALGDTGAAGFLGAVETLWREPTLAYPGGESNEQAQRRGVAVLTGIRKDRGGGHVVVSTHGNLMALMLQHVDPSVGYEFWRGLTMPDIYRVDWPARGVPTTGRLAMLPDRRVD